MDTEAVEENPWASLINTDVVGELMQYDPKILWRARLYATTPEDQTIIVAVIERHAADADTPFHELTMCSTENTAATIEKNPYLHRSTYALTPDSVLDDSAAVDLACNFADVLVEAGYPNLAKSVHEYAALLDAAGDDNPALSLEMYYNALVQTEAVDTLLQSALVEFIEKDTNYGPN